MAQDFIVRMLQQISAMLAGIVARKQRGDLAGAEVEVRERCLQHIGLPLDVVKHATPDAVAELLAAGGARRHAHGVLLAELLLQDAALAEARGNPPEALLGYQHAFRLLCDAADVLGGEEERHCRTRLTEIGVKLRDLGDGPLPPVA
jgi:hypothetical protein